MNSDKELVRHWEELVLERERVWSGRELTRSRRQRNYDRAQARQRQLQEMKRQRERLLPAWERAERKDENGVPLQRFVTRQAVADMAEILEAAGRTGLDNVLKKIADEPTREQASTMGKEWETQVQKWGKRRVRRVQLFEKTCVEFG